MAYFQVLTEPVIEQLSADCDKNCSEAKQGILFTVSELESEIEKQRKDWNEETTRLDIKLQMGLRSLQSLQQILISTLLSQRFTETDSWRK